MALALYRRYRPDTFEGVIGQDQVTVPLMRALDQGRLTHAYLFSGPRGCGKTSSARILARCVNCAQGPTSHPCGECASCRDLATGGPGSIDVVEIDAASHNGVDDARELRERAGFAPARDRYKIFILDEAHMVTQQGFNALLKIVEEPPEHVMFIFATTEPEKVIGTIRSRTHHYPFRLVPQEVMGPYLETICEREHIEPEPGVLRLAMRAGGGSMRDTLSVLDQLMVGSVDGVIPYDAAVALLGFTPEALIGEAIDAVIDRNGEALYGVVQKVVVGGFDPRRFVEDLLARVRDLLVLTLGGERAESVLSDDAAAEDMGDLRRQASALGLGELTAIAETINATLGSMTGATSPRMRLELLAARLLAGRENGFGAAGRPAEASVPAAGPAGAASPDGRQQRRGGFAAARSQKASQSVAQSSSGRPVSSPSAPAPSTATRPDAAQTGGAPQPSGQGTAPAAPSDAGWPSAASPQPSHAMPRSVAQATDGMPSGWGEQSAEPAPGGRNAAAGQPSGQPGAAPESADTRSVDQKWDAVVAGLPDDVREYVSRDKVPTVAYTVNPAGKGRLSMTFDSALSQHAFSLAVATDEANSGKKASGVVLDAVRGTFGAGTMIAPTTVAANGERVIPIKRLSPEQLAQVKTQIAMAKAGLAAANLSHAVGMRAGAEPRTSGAAGAPAPDGDDAGERTGAAAPAAPEPPRTGRGTTDGGAGHQHGHVAVPDLSDDTDPWAQPAGSAVADGGADAGAGRGPADGHDDGRGDDAGQGVGSGQGAGIAAGAPVGPVAGSHADGSVASGGAGGSGAFGGETSGATGVGHAGPAGGNASSGGGAVASGGASVDPFAGFAIDDDPWAAPLPAPQPMPLAAPAKANAPQPAQRHDHHFVPGRRAADADSDMDDPWANGGAGAYDPSGGASAPNAVSVHGGVGGDPVPGGPVQGGGPASSHGGASLPAGAQAGGPSAFGGAEPRRTGPQVVPEDDEYSLSDESLGTATALSIEELSKMFDVKKVEQFAADDPKNPKNAQPAKHTID